MSLMSDRTEQSLFAENALNPTILPTLYAFSFLEGSSGIFAVGETGKVSFDLLFEKKRVNGDLGLFRLEGIESLAVESEDFIREVIRRTASNSDLGHLIFSDRAIANNINPNIGTETLTMNQGETFALVFFPEGIETAIAHQIPPILSLTAGKFADVGDGQTVAMEVVENSEIDSLTGQLDRPYTDLIFRVEGATGQLEKLDILIPSEQDWRETSFGQKILISDVSIETVKSNSSQSEQIEAEIETVQSNSSQSEQTEAEIEIIQLNSSQSEQIEAEIETVQSNSSQSEQTEAEIEIIQLNLSQSEQIEAEIEIVQSNSSQSEQIEEEIEIVQSNSSQLEQTQKIPSDPFVSGVFTVGESGEVGFDFLFDGGKYKSELAIFSLDGMGEYEFGSKAFIQEATERALSNSSRGYVVIKDQKEGARFDGELGEKSWNQGEYKGVKTFQMEAGTRFGVMLIPNGTVKQVAKNPKINGAKQPLFSMALAGEDFGQIADLNGEGHTFAMEDVQPDHKWFDRDYNDIIFQVIGATGTAQSFDNAINPEKDWRQTELGQEILEYIKSSETISEKVKFIVDALYNPGESLSISGLINDEDGDVNISRVDFWLQKDGGEWVDIDDALEFVDDGDRAKFRYQLGELDSGKYHLKATPYDSEGKAGEIYEDAFTVLSVSQGEELSDRVKMAIERSMNLDTYDPEALAKTTEWIVSIQKGVNVDSLATLLGANNLGETGQIDNTYRWKFARGVDPNAIAELLKTQVGVEFAYPLVPLNIQWHSSPSDEPYVQNETQWHLGGNNIDVNVSDVWEQGIFGNGQTIGIVDSGFELHDPQFGLVGHPDLVDNYRPDLSWDFAENDAIASRLLRQNINFDPEDLPLPILEQGKVYFNSTAYNPGNIERGHNYFKVFSNVDQTISDLWVDLDIHNHNMSSLDVYIMSPSNDDISGIQHQLELDERGDFSGYVSAFNGEEANGEWIVKIIDRNPNDGFIGSLKNLTLRVNKTEQDHGTKVAGVAISNGQNGQWGTGIAPKAEWAALRMEIPHDGDLANILNDPNRNPAKNRNEQIEIYNNSWGLSVGESPRFFYSTPLAESAIEDGAKFRRQYLGNIYVFSAGNAAKEEHNVNYNSFANSRHTIAVAAIDPWGRQTTYSESGAPILVSAYSNAGTKDSSDRSIVTTGMYSNDGDNSNDYTTSSYGSTSSNFGGTSAAAPFVSGVIALMLEANPLLTSRDVQSILVSTSNWESIDDPDAGWTGESSDAIRHSHKYGFGVVDAAEAVEIAKTWTFVGEEVSLGEGDDPEGKYEVDVSLPIPNYAPNNPQSLISTITIAPEDNLKLEWVEVFIKGEHSYFGDLAITLTSPKGTHSILSEQHFNGHATVNYGQDQNKLNWVFTSVRHWGEMAAGEWTLEVADKKEYHPQLSYWTNWELNLYGTAIAPINTAPTLTNVATLNALENQPFSISYADLLAASDATDADGDAIAFIIEGLHSGTLTQNGNAVAVGTQISAGDVLEWTPDSAGDDVAAFTVKATDGNATSSTPVSVSLDVQAIPQGAVSGEIQVNTYTENSQSRPAIATLADGSYVVTWQSYGQDGDRWGVFAQRYDTLGNTLGQEFQINTETSSYQEHPSIAALQDGGFIVAWESLHQDGNGKGIFAQRFDGTGAKIAGEFQVNSESTGEQLYPAIASLNNGDFVITWQSEGQDGSDFGIFGQRYDAQGNTLGDEFQINTATTNDQNRPSISSLQDGGFLVTWASDGQDGSHEGIYGQRYNASGEKVSSEFNINTYSNGAQYVPTVTSLEDGGFAIAWQSEGQDGSAYGIYGQRFDSNSQPVGEEFRINTEVSQHQVNPAIAQLSNGGFVVTWQSFYQDGSHYDIYGQRFDSTGNVVGDEFQINTTTLSRQMMPSVTPLDNGTFVVAWQSYVQDGDGYAVISRIFGNEPETTTTENFAPQLSAIDLTPPQHGHQGSTDPMTERWMLSLKDGNTVGAVNDNGIEAWSTNDDLTTTGGAYYYRTLSRGESIIADTYGWKLSANLKIIELNDSPAGSIITSYRNGFDSYQLHWGSNADGDVMLRVLTDENGYETHTLRGVSANEYRDYDLIFDPDTKTVKVLVDGVEKISNYGGYNASGYNEHAPTNRQQIFWGAVSSSDTGEAYWQSVNFETLKPKATQGNPYTITYEELLASSDATDANGDDLSFVITSLEDGTLTKNGQAVILGNTTLSKGEKLLWTPDSAGDEVVAFSVKAYDGQSYSENSAIVSITVDSLPSQEVTVTVHRIAEIDDMDWFGGDADFRAIIGINGTSWTSPIQHNQNDISPNWQFTQEVTGTTIPISLTVHDEDTIVGGETFADVDINPQSGNTLNLTYNLLTGEVTGSGVNGIAGNQIQMSGNGDADRANIWFSIDVNDVPPAPPSPRVFHHLNQAYNSVQDSPLQAGASLAPLRVETFEDGALDTLGVTASAGSVVSGTPHSIEDNGSSWQVEQDSLTFSFDANLLGTLPTRAGVAVTDIANANIGTVAMEIFDSQGISLGITQPEELGSGDRFFGVEYAGGISKVTFTANSNDWQIDHLQYG